MVGLFEGGELSTMPEVGRKGAGMGLAAWMTAGSEPYPVESHSVMVDGARMHYVKAGSGPALVLVHGIIGSSYSWRYNLQSLAQVATVYAVDLLGLGQSERVLGLDASMKATADRVVKFLDAAGLRRADILGTSHGGAITMLAAARYPKRFGRTVLVAPANPFSDQSDAIIRFYRSSLGKWFALHVANLPPALQQIALGRMYGNPERVTPGTLENYMAALRVPGTAEHVMNILSNWFEDMNAVRDALEGLAEKPVLLLWGDKDRAVSLESAYQLQKKLPKSKLTVLSGTGHLPYEELPGEFNRAVKSWLDGVARRRHGIKLVRS